MEEAQKERELLVWPSRQGVWIRQLDYGTISEATEAAWYQANSYDTSTNTK